MDIQVLISTMDDKYLKEGNNIKTPSIIVNQLVNKEESEYSQDNLFSIKEKGLSRSRNRALRLSKATICLISDDDLSYKDGFDKKILEIFRENPDADIITFMVDTDSGDLFKTYKQKPFYHTYATLMKVSSVEISFRREVIMKNQIVFDESFGLGTEFATGEEVIFLTDALKKGLKILFVPIIIATHPLVRTSGANFDNINLIMAKGAMFYRIFGFFGFFIGFLFAVKKYKLSKIGFWDFYHLMIKGIIYYNKKNM